MAALNVGVIRYNDKSRLVKGASGEEFPLMFERDEMKKVVGPLPHDSPIATSTHNIMIDDPYGRLGGDSILRTIIDFEEDTRTDVIVNECCRKMEARTRTAATLCQAKSG